MKPYPFAALNHFTTPCSLLNFFTPRRDLRDLPGVTPVGGARLWPGSRALAPLRDYKTQSNAAQCWHKTARPVQNLCRLTRRSISHSWTVIQAQASEFYCGLTCPADVGPRAAGPAFSP